MKINGEKGKNFKVKQWEVFGVEIEKEENGDGNGKEGEGCEVM